MEIQPQEINGHLDDGNGIDPTPHEGESTSPAAQCITSILFGKGNENHTDAVSERLSGRDSELPEVQIPRHGHRQKRRLYRLSVDAFRRRVQMLSATTDAYQESVAQFCTGLRNTHNTEIRLLRLLRRLPGSVNDLTMLRLTSDLLRNTKDQAINHLLGVSMGLKQVSQVIELLRRVFQGHLLVDLLNCPYQAVLEFKRVTDYHNINSRIVAELTKTITRLDRHFHQSYLFAAKELSQLLLAAAVYKPKYM